MGGVGSGSKPKVYPAEFVERVRVLYGEGHTQDEIASMLGVTQKVVWRLMTRHEIPRRPQIKRDQRGARNASWKGDAATYAACHLRVQVARGTPSRCEHCGTTSAKRFEWANLTGRYSDVTDYIRLCISCHHRMDGTVKNLGHYAERRAG